ncbi:unnamed protein product [Prorocentrum cordatum]|uniref:PDZ domain-containing protein n=1 Tax=Prorocentrum cordatum TaxID=2364126 RepID=A0ABN9QHT7_9DINO|nr:unnamed protein product [Polarella glacialis]
MGGAGWIQNEEAPGPRTPPPGAEGALLVPGGSSGAAPLSPEPWGCDGYAAVEGCGWPPRAAPPARAPWEWAGRAGAPGGGAPAAAGAARGAWPGPVPLALADQVEEPVSGNGGWAGSFRFSFCIRSAEGNDLGLDVAYEEGDTDLLVAAVLEGGAIDSWNRQCCGDKASRAIQAGDRIESVNGATGILDMLWEVHAKKLLRLCVRRDFQ